MDQGGRVLRRERDGTLKMEKPGVPNEPPTTARPIHGSPALFVARRSVGGVVEAAKAKAKGGSFFRMKDLKVPSPGGLVKGRGRGHTIAYQVVRGGASGGPRAITGMRRRVTCTPLRQVVLVLALFGGSHHRAHGAPLIGRDGRQGSFPNAKAPSIAPAEPAKLGRGAGGGRVGADSGGGAVWWGGRAMFELMALCNQMGWTLAPEEGRGGDGRYVLTMGGGETESAVVDSVSSGDHAGVW